MAGRYSTSLIAANCLVILSLWLSAGCAPTPPVADEHQKTVAGIAEMSQDGVLTTRMFNAPPGMQVETIKPNNPAYQEMIDLVRGIKPGEKKEIPRVVGEIRMAADGVITYYLMTGQSRSVFTEKPGGVGYKNLVSRVGGLKPGEKKMIPMDDEKK